MTLAIAPVVLSSYKANIRTLIDCVEGRVSSDALPPSRSKDALIDVQGKVGDLSVHVETIIYLQLAWGRWGVVSQKH